MNETTKRMIDPELEMKRLARELTKANDTIALLTNELHRCKQPLESEPPDDGEHIRPRIERIAAENRELRKKVEEHENVKTSLEYTLETLEKIIEGMPFGIVTIGRDKKVRSINGAALRLIGMARESVVDHPCHMNICPAQTDHCPVWDLGETVSNAESALIGSAGRQIPVLKSVIPISLGGEEILLEAFVDMSFRKRMEQQQEIKMRELEEFRRFAVDRELRMIELKKEVNQLLIEYNREKKYPDIK